VDFHAGRVAIDKTDLHRAVLDVLGPKLGLGRRQRRDGRVAGPESVNCHLSLVRWQLSITAGVRMPETGIFHKPLFQY